MKICVTAQGDRLDSQVDPRFGRCPYFIIVDTETAAFEAFENQNRAGMGGVGVQSGRFVAEQGAKTVLTGHVGPNASKTLQAAGVAVVVDVAGTVQEAVEQYKAGALTPSEGPNVNEKSGMQDQ